MHKTEIELSPGDTPMLVYEVEPAGHGPYAAAILLMDGLGIRDSLRQMAERFASEGYYVLLPDLYHRLGNHVHFDPAWMTIPEKVGEIRKVIGSLTAEQTMADVEACLDHIRTRANVDATRIGVVGYCMGGRNAFRAAIEFPDRIRAAAAIHPGGVVTDEPSSPHLGASRVKARLYFARAKDDMFFTAEQATVLGESLSAAGARYEIAPYEGRHGFAIPDAPIYDANEAERHWNAVLTLFRSEL